MKFSYSWLSELSGFKGSAKNLAELLSLQAFETEIVSESESFEKIIVAKVTKVDKHPNADRLRVITLTDGERTIGPVVCGAWNFDVGAVVALALPGALIPHDLHSPEGKSFVLTKATIRGVESQGMICAGKELGIADESNGVMILDSSYQLGAAFTPKNLGKEIIFDISVPANRPDLLSYHGVAWEISVLTNSKYGVKPTKSKLDKLKAKILKVRISETNLCTKYAAVRLGNLVVGPSPKFIQDRLVASGLRPINNVVDIANYAMLATGQPLHAFDASKVMGAINVRKAFVHESIKTLDGVEQKLSSDVLVIADTKQPIAIAGIIGGQESAIIATTSEIILEGANFNAVSIRRTARSLGLRTDASSRFEKSLPPAFVNHALNYAVELLVQYAQATPLEFAETGSKTVKPTIVAVDPNQVRNLLGLEVSDAEQKKILTKFGFTVNSQKSKVIVTVSYWRPDVTIWQDLAEEVGRYLGLQKIPTKLPMITPSSHMSDPRVDARNLISDLLVGLGFDETYTYSFTPLQQKNSVEVANPLSHDQKYLRTGVGMNYEKILEHNSKISPSGNYFEIGNAYWREENHIREQTRLYLISYSKDQSATGKLLGGFRELMARLGINYEIKQTSETGGEVWVANKSLGPILANENSDIKWTALEISFDELVEQIRNIEYRAINRYPATELDVALMVKLETPWAEIKQTILNGRFQFVSDVQLIEVYSGKNISPGKKSVTLRIVYQSPDKTLTDAEVEKIHKQMITQLESKLHAQIR